MKHISSYIIICIVALLLGACTHNNGDIGPLFGTWVIDDMTVDGTSADLGDDDTFMQFQGHIVLTKLIDPRHSLLRYCAGTWTREGDVLALDYTNGDDNNHAGTGTYAAPEWLLLETNAINRLNILSLDNAHMSLRYVADDGRTVVYNFRKTH